MFIKQLLELSPVSPDESDSGSHGNHPIVAEIEKHDGVIMAVIDIETALASVTIYGRMTLPEKITDYVLFTPTAAYIFGHEQYISDHEDDSYDGDDNDHGMNAKIKFAVLPRTWNMIHGDEYYEFTAK